MPPAPSDGNFDYYVLPIGAHRVVRGYETYVLINSGMLSGTSKFQPGTYRLIIRDLPPHTAVHWPDQEYNGMQQGNRGTTYKPNDTITLYDPEATQFELVTDVGGQTPPANYTLHITSTAKQTNSAQAVSKNVEWTLAVDPPSPIAGKPTSYPPIPKLSTWQSQMITYGAGNWCAMKNRVGQYCGDGYDQCVTYYDGERVYYQIADYDAVHHLTHKPEQWNSCALNSQHSYRDNYVLVQKPPGAMKGYWVFPQGLYMNYQRTGDALSKSAVHDLAINGYSIWAGNGQMADAVNVRETAYKLEAYWLDTKLGNDHSVQVKQLVATLLGDIDQICVSGGAGWHQPFMDGLMAEALIDYYEDGHQDDVRIPAAIKTLADYLWDHAWIPNHDAGFFYYNSYQSSIGMPQDSNLRNLNLLIAPMYAWLFKVTGDSTYQQRGDVIWVSGITDPPEDGIAWSGKNFSQNYRWSFDYVKWRSASAASESQSDKVK